MLLIIRTLEGQDDKKYDRRMIRRERKEERRKRRKRKKRREKEKNGIHWRFEFVRSYGGCERGSCLIRQHVENRSPSTH